MLRNVRLRGAMLFHVEGAAPWVVEAPPAATVAAAALPGADHVMAYHVVAHGACWGAVAGAPPVRAERGDVIVFAHGDPHVMSSAPGMRPAAPDNPIFVPPREHLPTYVRVRGDRLQIDPPRDDDATGGPAEPEATTLLCGFFGCDARPFNPLIASLPPLLHVRAADEGGWLDQFIRFAQLETTRQRPGGAAVLERLSETMFVDLIRRHLDHLPDSDAGWLAGLRDRHVGRALALLHESPARHWTIEQLADHVGLSRSALHDRFVQFTGQPPMQYLTGWRMQVAAGLLTQTATSVAAIALEVGYDSEAAFGRAFKRATGTPPAAWRRARSRAGA